MLPLKLFLLAALVSCGKVQREYTSMTGALTYKCSKHGVEYVQSNSGIAVSYNANGEVIKCN